MSDEENEELLDSGVVSLLLQPPENAVQGDWIVFAVEKLWVGRDNRRGKTDPSGGMTVRPPKGYEVRLALPMFDLSETPEVVNFVSDRPEGTITLDDLKDRVMKPLAKAIDSLVDGNEF